ncbi:hypothetical protein DLM86_04385 [Paenibacillus flagellatus]|uniref:HTH araC/xylS-type domain-containing protein n=2 Tax=Paenibacillus flagellatus TaxID=2211139 RepID=A0A2V5KWF4_9BACL|nr:hypothetical protein DLM86_04385 [Paenibacillus flagellatus]
MHLLVQELRPSAHRPSVADVFEAVKTHLEQEFAQDVKVRDLADKFAISATYLRRLFLQRLGMTPKHYLQQVRNEHACRYLTYTGMSMKDVARACGYADEFHFSKAFRRMNGRSPSDYRLHASAARSERMITAPTSGGPA